MTIFTGSDTYDDAYLSGPLVPDELIKTIAGDVRIGQGVVIGAHAVILPGVEIADGASVGAMCIVNMNCVPGGVYVCGGGRPRKVSTRDLITIRAQVAQTLDRCD